MIIKKFVAPTMAEALSKVKKELGDQAVILKTRMNRRGGVNGDPTEKSVEVTAAIDNGVKSRLAETPNDEIRSIQSPSPPQPDTKSDLKSPSELLNNILQEVTDIKSTLGKRNSNHCTLFGNLPSELIELGRLMVARNFPEDFAVELISSVARTENVMNLKRPELLQMLKSRLQSIMPRAEGINIHPAGATVAMLIGPTGSGKTTALAKIAMNHKLDGNTPLAVISADNFRADSGQQIKSYCRIISCPCAIVYGGDELSMAIKSQKEGLILIDTPGVNPRNAGDVSELLTLVRAARPHEIYLVVAASTPAADLFDYLNAFSDLNVDKFLITKLDETISIGGVIAAAVKSGKKLSFVSRSREIPGQFVIASPELLAEMAFEESSEQKSINNWQMEVVGLWQ